MKDSRSKLVLLCAVFYLSVVAMIAATIVRGEGGHLIYAMDDPYIHLALAENLAHGHYGINPTEFSSPSSSVLWPFLLIPFAGTHFHPYVPLAWNILFGLLAACLIGYAVGKWPPQEDGRTNMPFWQRAIIAVLLVFSANIISLTLAGMEHVLQVFLSICCAIGVMEALSARPIPMWCRVAATVAPMVRYEDLALTVAICCALAGVGAWKKAAVVLGLSVMPLVAFSIWLKAHGLPALPLSVLVKGNSHSAGNLLLNIFSVIRWNLSQIFISNAVRLVVLLFLIMIGLAWTAKTRARRFAFSGAALVGGLHLALGRFGWFHRYEVYALIFLLLICWHAVADRPRFPFAYTALALVLCAGPYVVVTLNTVASSRDIYQQQYQMHRFVTGYYRGDYAVNDLGLVSFQRTPGTYVLDVWGLASAEAARQRDKTPAWLDGIVQRHHVGLAMLYASWFKIPGSWTPVAKMCISDAQPVIPSSPCMVFYGTSPDATVRIRESMARFAPTLPPGVVIHLDPSRKESSVGWK